MSERPYKVALLYFAQISAFDNGDLRELLSDGLVPFFLKAGRCEKFPDI
jgi:hypothetical protein